MNGKEWTAEDQNSLRRMFPDEPSAAVAAVLGRSLSAVRGHAAKLKLKKSEAYLASSAACRLRRGDNVGKEFRFKPGHAPANKGLRRPGYAPGRMRETQFTKGSRPLNWVPVGSVIPNADGYLRIKVADTPQSVAGKGARSSNWEFVHRRVWESAHGPIPKGHRIWWKDGDHMNCALENLELLTDKEHMARTTIHKLPPELKEVILLKGRLQKTIRRREKANAQESAAGPAGSSVRNA